jgi:voltage-gated potassium channel Kch
VIPLLLAFRGLAKALAAVWRDPETKALPAVAGALVLTGSLFYWRFEDWTYIEALYFSIVTLTTVGYGDFSPTTAGTQTFTIFHLRDLELDREGAHDAGRRRRNPRGADDRRDRGEDAAVLVGLLESSIYPPRANLVQDG